MSILIQRRLGVVFVATHKEGVFLEIFGEAYVIHRGKTQGPAKPQGKK